MLAEITLRLARGKPKVIGLSMPLDKQQYRAGLASLSELHSTLKRENKLSRNVRHALRVTEQTLRGDDKLAASLNAAGSIVLAMPYIAASDRAPGLSPAFSSDMQHFALPRSEPTLPA